MNEYTSMILLYIFLFLLALFATSVALLLECSPLLISLTSPVGKFNGYGFLEILYTLVPLLVHKGIPLPDAV